MPTLTLNIAAQLGRSRWTGNFHTCYTECVQVTSQSPFCCLHLQVLNYGQSVFEGMKAQRSAKGRIVLFRPDQNAARMADGAARLSMPAPPSDLFVGAVQQLVRENQDYVPPQGKGSLYIRPLLMGSGGILGLGPAPTYTFAIFCAAVGAYFKVSLHHLNFPYAQSLF